MIPDPPLDGDGDVRVFSFDIERSLVNGVAGGCVSCGETSVTWWSLAACGMPPVTDRTGALTEYVALHARCILGVLTVWCMLIHGGDAGEDELPGGSPGGGRAESESARVVSREPDAPARARPKSGIYARDRG